MTVTLYRKRHEGITYVGMELPDGSAVEQIRGRRAMRELRLIAKYYGVTKIKKGLKNR